MSGPEREPDRQVSRREALRAERAERAERRARPPRARRALAELAEVARPWTTPTRRRFFGMVMAAGAVAVAAGKVVQPEEPGRSTWSGKTRWIGHC
jgi:hypothetical protein